MPKKQVILSQDEYNALINIAASALKISNKYVVNAHKDSELVGHIADSKECDPDQKVLYSQLISLYYNNEPIRADVSNMLPNGYIYPEGSAWLEEDM